MSLLEFMNKAKQRWLDKVKNDYDACVESKNEYEYGYYDENIDLHHCLGAKIFNEFYNKTHHCMENIPMDKYLCDDCDDFLKKYVVKLENQKTHHFCAKPDCFGLTKERLCSKHLRIIENRCSKCKPIIENFYTFILCMQKTKILIPKDILKIIFNRSRSHLFWNKKYHIETDVRNLYKNYQFTDYKIATKNYLYVNFDFLDSCPQEYTECALKGINKNCVGSVPKQKDDSLMDPNSLVCYNCYEFSFT